MRGRTDTRWTPKRWCYSKGCIADTKDAYRNSRTRAPESARCNNDQERELCTQTCLLKGTKVLLHGWPSGCRSIGSLIQAKQTHLEACTHWNILPPHSNDRALDTVKQSKWTREHPDTNNNRSTADDNIHSVKEQQDGGQRHVHK